MGFSIISHPFWGTTIYGTPHVLDEYKPQIFRGPITPLVKTHHAKLPFAIAALARDFWHG
jgi:hypothetical protein